MAEPAQMVLEVVQRVGVHDLLPWDRLGHGAVQMRRHRERRLGHSGADHAQGARQEDRFVSSISSFRHVGSRCASAALRTR